MGAVELLARARAVGVELTVRHGALHLRGPCPEDLRPELREHREALVALLVAEDAAPAPWTRLQAAGRLAALQAGDLEDAARLAAELTGGSLRFWRRAVLRQRVTTGQLPGLTEADVEAAP